MGSVSSNRQVKKPNRGKLKGSKGIPKSSTLLDIHGHQLQFPLSKLTKDMAHGPTRDMENWVHRSTEVRRQEPNRNHGKVARPLNSFLLYRKAYSGPAKQLLGEKNHSILSVVIGRSWKMESQDVRYLFQNLANIDKRKHMEAHPSYKYSPKPRHARGNSRRDDTSLCVIGTGVATAQSRPELEFSPDWTHGFNYLSTTSSQVSSCFNGAPMLDNVQSGYSLSGLPGALHPDLLDPREPVPIPRAAATVWFEGQLLEMQDFSLSRTFEGWSSYDPYHGIGQGA
ncbi:HMG-box domain-containing protein [Aspergillus alliaceus]|uniref:HMG-box domain-containing protein n=1 Tax=Petromyces alliaceus TaxID=209559 RepID=UPI0012A747DD|nr:uncharacterized protein BDW43DRAFT_317006 [Aspergillus alliaceus]KAB8227263.1 hypothetical protein BDW43DRAFT_317006 [Aspergillus alliaceus]